jgi:hypothetical protein
MSGKIGEATIRLFLIAIKIDGHYLVTRIQIEYAS